MQTTLFDIREFEGSPAPLTPKHQWIEANADIGKGGSAKVVLYSTAVYGGAIERRTDYCI